MGVSLTKRLCKKCKSNEHMNKLIDDRELVYDERWRICFKCQPNLEDDIDNVNLSYMVSIGKADSLESEE